MKKLTLITLLAFAIQSQAATVQSISQPTRFDRMHRVLEDFCKSSRTTLDCQVQAYRVQFLGSQKSWSQAVRQVVGNEYTHALNFTEFKRDYDQVVERYEYVAQAAGFSSKRLMMLGQWENLQEAISNDVMDEPSVKIFAGHVSGNFSLDHEFVAFVDTKNNELIVFRGGYSE